MHSRFYQRLTLNTKKSDICRCHFRFPATDSFTDNCPWIFETSPFLQKLLTKGLSKTRQFSAVLVVSRCLIREILSSRSLFNVILLIPTLYVQTEPRRLEGVISVLNTSLVKTFDMQFQRLVWDSQTISSTEAYNLVKKETPTQVFSCTFCGTFKKTLIYETSPVTGSGLFFFLPASIYSSKKWFWKWTSQTLPRFLKCCIE